MWSESTLHAELSESRIPWQISTDIPSWMAQQYRIINLLRYPKLRISSWEGTKQKNHNDGGASADWATAVASFNAKPFTDVSGFYPTVPPQHWATKVYPFTPGKYFIARIAAKVPLTNPFPISSAVKFWDMPNAGDVTYENNDYPGWGVVEKYTLIIDGGIQLAETNNLSSFIGDINNNSMSQPADGTYNLWELSYLIGITVNRPVNVHQPNFEYKNW